MNVITFILTLSIAAGVVMLGGHVVEDNFKANTHATIGKIEAAERAALGLDEDKQ